MNCLRSVHRRLFANAVANRRQASTTSSSKTDVRIKQMKFTDAQFEISKEWNQRLEVMIAQGLSNADEWISMIQKKYSSGGQASAIDLDIAAVLATERTQIGSLIDIVYQLRHTKHAGHVLPSTDYSLLKLIMKYRHWAPVFKVLNDPINYGLFLNEHLTCLAMDHLLASGNIQGAAKIATIAMQQEMFEFTFLNVIAIYCLLKWSQLPVDKQIFDEQIHPKAVVEGEENEDELKVFKFPYLKNEWNDGHFDVTDPKQLVGKSIEWFSYYLPRELPKSSEQEAYSTMREKLISYGVALQQSESTKEGDESKILSKLNENMILPDDFAAAFSLSMIDEQTKILDFQKQQFEEWNNTRSQLIQVQAEYLDLRLRLDEIAALQKSLEDEKKLLYFFENRSMYEDTAKAKEELYAGLDSKLGKSAKHAQEKEYQEGLFELYRK